MTDYHRIPHWRSFGKSRIVLILACCGLLLATLQAVGSELPAVEQGETKQDVSEESVFSILDKPHHMISTGLTDFTNRVDNYFSNEKNYYEATGSFIRLTADMIWDEESNDVGYKGDVRLKLNLPRTKKKLKFILESDSDQGRSDVDPVMKSTPLDAADEESYYAGLQTLSGGGNDRWIFRRTLGIKVRAPLDYFVRLRANKKYKLAEWRLRLDEGIFWFDSSGVGVDSSVEFDYALANELLFRSRSYARWSDDDKNVELSQVFSVFQALSERELMAYQLGVYGETKPSIIATDYLVAIRYRRNVHDGYLFAEIVPQLLFNKERGFHPEHSILFRLEWLFTG